MDCPHCHSKDTVITNTNKHSIKRLFCKVCSAYYEKLDAPKVLLFDIETSRTETTVWRMGEQRVGWKQITKPEFIISWSAKWLFNPESMAGVVTPKEAKKRDCKRIIKDIHSLLDKADCVITHNGDRFDIKKLNWYFIKFGLRPNNRYKSIDTLKEYRKVSAPPSVALDYLAQELGYDGKHDTDMSLWERCEAGDQEALNQMSDYNTNDVFITENIYLRVRGWMKTHPNFAMYLDMYQDLEEGEYKCPR